MLNKMMITSRVLQTLMIFQMKTSLMRVQLTILIVKILITD